MNNLVKFFYNVIIQKKLNHKKDHLHLIMRIKKMCIIQRNNSSNTKMNSMTLCPINIGDDYFN